jgi:hypothetical protein
MIQVLITEIVAKGTGLTLITNIINYADALKLADNTQESIKGTRKTATAIAIKEFNRCFTAVIRICKLSAKYYKEQPDLKVQFSYSKVLKAMNNATNKIPVPPVKP